MGKGYVTEERIGLIGKDGENLLLHPDFCDTPVACKFHCLSVVKHAEAEHKKTWHARKFLLLLLENMSVIHIISLSELCIF